MRYWARNAAIGISARFRRLKAHPLGRVIIDASTALLKFLACPSPPIGELLYGGCFSAVVD
jgi:hypothetical protein